MTPPKKGTLAYDVWRQRQRVAHLGKPGFWTGKKREPMSTKARLKLSASLKAKGIDFWRANAAKSNEIRRAKGMILSPEERARRKTASMIKYRAAHKADMYAANRAWVKNNLARRREIARLSQKRRYWAKKQLQPSSTPL